MSKKNSLLLVIFLLAAVLVALLVFAKTMGNDEPTEPSESQQASTDTTPRSGATEATQESTADTTPSSEATTPSSEATQPETQATIPETQPSKPTEPTSPGVEFGTLYTRAELEAMDTTEHGYGPGNTSDGKRPPYAQSDQKKFGKYGGNFIAPDDNNVYLTFDCGYEYYATDENGNKYRNTEHILNTLKEKDVKAVFFVTGQFVREQPDLVQRMIDEGHAIGNHSNRHPVMPQQSIDRMVEEVMTLHNYVLDKFGYEMTLFRPPTGAFSIQSLAVVQNLGYKNVHWSFAYYDYEPADQPTTAKAYETITGRHHSGAIYLLHAVSTSNAAVLGQAIDFFRAEGYNLELFR